MVKRWTIDVGFENDPYMDEYEKGEYVLYSDYQKVLEALEEALMGWGKHMRAHCGDAVEDERIYQLRSLYLGGGK